MYREPIEVVASVIRKTTAVLVARHSPQAAFLADKPLPETTRLDRISYLGACYSHYLKQILNAAVPPKLLNYRSVNADKLEQVLADVFTFYPQPEQLQAMQQQFLYYSKAEHGQTLFSRDSQHKQSALSLEQKTILNNYCALLVGQLDHSEHNLFPVNS